MKLKEKLAKDSSQDFWDSFPQTEQFIMNPDLLYSLIFQKGFEKAREMAAEICDQATHELWGESDATKEIRNLGEEEV